VPPAPLRSARGTAGPLAAAAGPGSHAQGRQAAPLRMALEQFSALAALAACPARRGSPAGVPRSQVERGAAGGGPAVARDPRTAGAPATRPLLAAPLLAGGRRAADALAGSVPGGSQRRSRRPGQRRAGANARWRVGAGGGAGLPPPCAGLPAPGRDAAVCVRGSRTSCRKGTPVSAASGGLVRAAAGEASPLGGPRRRLGCQASLPAPRGGDTRARTAEAPVPPPSAPQGAGEGRHRLRPCRERTPRTRPGGLPV
jgi:hypothetical protein